MDRAGAGGGKNKAEKVAETAERYLAKARLLLDKLHMEVPCLPIGDETDVALVMVLEHFMGLMEKYIDMVGRRVLKGEKIPHQEKMFSIFETYTEWITKGKMNLSVELGKGWKRFLLTTGTGTVFPFCADRWKPTNVWSGNKQKRQSRRG
ncbi:MAG: hypothetical protein AB2L20_11120 [Mangrovibacterium sp.]